MTDDPLTERECWKAMDTMIDHIAHIETELFKSDLIGIVTAFAALLVGALLF